MTLSKARQLAKTLRQDYIAILLVLMATEFGSLACIWVEI